MTICVLGMHRSGTSMIARLLNVCGMSLGKPEDIMSPHTIDNPDGYWENKRIVDLNDEVLKTMGGSDQWPPQLPPGWQANPLLAKCREKAQKLIDEFEGEQVWGWKDPRTMLTLPLWQTLLPEIKYVLIYRNPLEVALSLGKRQEYVDAFFVPNLNQSLYLWTQYHLASLDNMPEDTIVCSYTAFFSEPEKELRRVLDGLGWQVPDEKIKEAASYINPELRRNRIGADFLAEEFISDEIRHLCSELDRRSGSTGADKNGTELETYRRLMKLAMSQLASQSQLVIGTKTIIDEREHTLHGAQAEAESLRMQVERLKDDLDWHKAEVSRLEKLRHEAEARARDLHEELRVFGTRLDENGRTISGLYQQLAEANKTLRATVEAHEQHVKELAQILRHRSFLERLVTRLRSR